MCEKEFIESPPKRIQHMCSPRTDCKITLHSNGDVATGGGAKSRGARVIQQKCGPRSSIRASTNQVNRPLWNARSADPHGICIRLATSLSSYRGWSHHARPNRLPGGNDGAFERLVLLRLLPAGTVVVGRQGRSGNPSSSATKPTWVSSISTARFVIGESGQAPAPQSPTLSLADCATARASRPRRPLASRAASIRKRKD